MGCVRELTLVGHRLRDCTCYYENVRYAISQQFQESDLLTSAIDVHGLGK